MVIFLQRTFTSLVNAHVGRTHGVRGGRAKSGAPLNFTLGPNGFHSTVPVPTDC